MDRRRFLHFLVLGATAPAVLSACRGSEPVQEGVPAFDPADPLRSTWKRAQAMGKPLLVIAVPKNTALLTSHEQKVGYYLNHCDDEALFDLAQTEVVAATAEEMHRLVDELPAHEDQFGGSMPMMWLVSTASVAPRAVAVGENLPELYPFGFQSEDDWETQELRFKESLDARNGLLAQDLRSQLWSDEAARAERAAHSDRAFLIEGARKRLREAPPEGTVWAVSTGCGCEIEGEGRDEQALMIACGMGMVPAHASRFLRFYSAS